MVINYVGDRRVPLALVLITAVLLYGLHEWADLHYMPFATAQASELAMMKKIDANGALLKNHISAYESNEKEKDRMYQVNENKKAILVVRDQLFSLQQFEDVNGQNSMTKERREDLDVLLDDLMLIRQCFVNGNGTCK